MLRKIDKIADVSQFKNCPVYFNWIWEKQELCPGIFFQATKNANKSVSHNL